MYVNNEDHNDFFLQKKLNPMFQRRKRRNIWELAPAQKSAVFMIYYESDRGEKGVRFFESAVNYESNPATLP
jgi:hypothetical protein